jgi:hypothetical protein
MSLHIEWLAAAAVAVFLASIFAIAWRRSSLRNAAEARLALANRQRQAQVLSRLDALSALLANPDIPSGEVEPRAEAIFQEIAALGEAGSLDALVADTRLYVSEEMAKRRSSIAGR